jgi:hypothetical protein
MSAVANDASDSRLQSALEALQAGKASEVCPALLILHEEGTAEATRLLGLMHLNGDGVERDPEKGEAYLKESSAAGNAEATFALAQLQPTAEDHARVMLKAAEQGHLIAAQQIGLYYFRGDGIEADNPQAYRWLFSIGLRTPVAAETFTEPLAELEAELSAEDKEWARVEAWNFVYVDTRSGWHQEEFDAVNPDFSGRITTENYEIVDGQLLVR